MRSSVSLFWEDEQPRKLTRFFGKYSAQMGRRGRDVLTGGGDGGHLEVSHLEKPKNWGLVI